MFVCMCVCVFGVCASLCLSYVLSFGRLLALVFSCVLSLSLLYAIVCLLAATSGASMDAIAFHAQRGGSINAYTRVVDACIELRPPHFGLL